MKPNLSIVTSFLLLIGWAGCSANPQRSPVVPSVPSSSVVSDDARAGGKLFSQHCASCHGAGAVGTSRAPSLRRETVQAMDEAALVQFLTDGDLRNGMPSWSRLPVERRWQLVRFLKTLPAQGADPANHRGR